MDVFATITQEMLTNARAEFERSQEVDGSHFE